VIVALVRLAGDCADVTAADVEAAAAAAGATLRPAAGAADLGGARIVCVVGGAGAALDDELARALRKLRAPVLGICGGAAALVRAGLLDAALVDPPPPGAATCIVEGRATAFTAALPAGRMLRLGHAHVGLAVGEQAEAEGRVLLRLCRDDGELDTMPIAVCGSTTVVGVAAHLSGDGASLLHAAVAWLRKTPARIDLR
jgi:phosphoribosylformylglycinamidine (FGAM) synthase-like amidotransferase family enzyme